HHHARATPIRRVVDLTVGAQTVLADVVEIDLDDSRIDRSPDDSDRERPGEVFREDGDERDAHSGVSLGRRGHTPPTRTVRSPYPGCRCAHPRLFAGDGLGGVFPGRGHDGDTSTTS